jgi:hypothetical protein
LFNLPIRVPTRYALDGIKYYGLSDDEKEFKQIQDILGGSKVNVAV